jgi:hypothetical protein
MATPDNGLAAVIYSPSMVNAKVGDNTNISITNKTNYPFSDDLIFKITADKSDLFPIYFRIPSWSKKPKLLINGKTINTPIEAGKFIKINRKWSNGDIVKLVLPKDISVKKWEKNHNSVSVNYGPLTFSLNIQENYVEKLSDKTAIGDSRWQDDADTDEWPTYEIYPDSDWNYGLILDDNLDNTFEVVQREWPEDNFPFTNDSAPILIRAKARKIPEWKMDKTTGLVGELTDSPVESDEIDEIVELVPMGGSRLRISSFPVIKN